MKIQKIRKIAEQMSINAGSMSKEELVRTIQTAEGNSPCYATSRAHECDQMNCLWREDCMRVV